MSNRHLLYLIGQPGSGKTTLATALFADLPQVQRPAFHPYPPFIEYPGGAQIGVMRSGFGGTDVLPLNCQPNVIAWMQQTGWFYLFAEGDRLANDKFFHACRAAGICLSVVHLDCADELAQERRVGRGSNQNAAWVKGRASKVQRLAEVWVDDAWRLSASSPLDHLVKRLRQHPVIKGIRCEQVCV